MGRRAGILLSMLLGCGIAAARDPVLTWTSAMLDVIRVDDTAPTLSTRNLAILHTAIYDAVNSIDRTHQPYLAFYAAPVGASADAAAEGAGSTVFRALYPSFAGIADSLHAAFLAEVAPTEALTNSLSFGAQVAREALEARSADGSATAVPYIPSAEPGQWRRTPPLYRPPLDPHWRYVALFGLPDVDGVMPPPPPPLASAAYAAAFEEVKTLGAWDSTVRSEEQTRIAVFWSDFSYTAMPPGHWHEITIRIAQERAGGLAEHARLFALLSIAEADAAIVCWEAKYRYNLWRPVTAIQRAGEDDNPDTEADPVWDSLLAAPPFPEYPSGHSTFSKAGAQVLTRFFGTDAIHFEVTSDSLPGEVRGFDSLAACADEVGMSRIYGGIHFQFANREGKACGQRIADHIFDNFLQPDDQLPSLTLESVGAAGAQIRLRGHADHALVLESSGDLAEWTPVSTNAAKAGGVVVLDAAPDPSRFYRVIER